MFYVKFMMQIDVNKISQIFNSFKFNMSKLKNVI